MPYQIRKAIYIRQKLRQEILLTNIEEVSNFLNHVIKHSFSVQIFADILKVRTFVLCFS